MQKERIPILGEDTQEVRDAKDLAQAGTTRGWSHTSRPMAYV